MRSIDRQPIIASAARSSDGVTSSFNVSRSDLLMLTFDVTAVSGTGARIGFAIQFGPTPSGPWATVKEVVRATAAGSLSVRIPTAANYLRISYDIEGTSPSITFSIEASWRE